MRVYGNLERFCKWAKLLMIFGLCALMIAVKAGAGRTDQPQPQHEKDFTIVPGFAPAGFSLTFSSGDPENEGIPGQGGRFLAIWYACTMAMFPLMGGDLVVVTAGEAAHPRRDLPAAARFMYLAPIALYIVSSFLVGLNINFADPGLGNPWNTIDQDGSFSPFILVLNYTTLRGITGFLNACFIFSAYTAGNTALFVSSRTLFSLAQRYGNARLVNTVGRTNYGRTPIMAILVCWVFSLLAFLGVQSERGAGYTQPILTLSAFFVSSVSLVYISQCVAYLIFKSGLSRYAREGSIRRDSKQYMQQYYRASWQPACAWLGLVGCALVVVFSGWPAIYIMVARQSLATRDLLKSNTLLAADIVGAYSGVSGHHLSELSQLNLAAGTVL